MVIRPRPSLTMEKSGFGVLLFPLAVFNKFGILTSIKSPADSIIKVILIVRQYPAEIGTTPFSDSWKIRDFYGYHFQWPFLKNLVTKLTSIGKVVFIIRLYPAENIGTTPIFDCGKIMDFRDIISNSHF